MATLYIQPDGAMQGIYSDMLVDFLPIGDASITRASHVEPGRDDHGELCWYADMSPSGGPQLGPFYTRQQALDEEVQWLKDNILEVKKEGEKWPNATTVTNQ